VACQTDSTRRLFGERCEPIALMFRYTGVEAQAVVRPTFVDCVEWVRLIEHATTWYDAYRRTYDIVCLDELVSLKYTISYVWTS
jgi:hypothetical protein